MAQLPQEAQGAAIAILVYTFLCLLCNVLMLWLLWTSRQMFSPQQIYDNLYWVDVQTARFNHIKANVGNPLLAASNGVTGLDLVLWAIRYGSETVAAGLACCWALSLTQAVYGWAKCADWILVKDCGKVIAIILPIIFLGIIHLDAVQQSTVLFYFLLDVLFFSAVAGGAFGLLMILIKYIITRRELKLWEVTTHVNGHTTWRSFRLSDDAPADQMPAQHSMGIYDNWLLVRFSVAFFFMIVFEVDTIVIQISGEKAMRIAAAATAPDLSASLATKNFALFLPSAFASALGLFTFGTTSHFRNTMYTTFVPKRWQRQHRQGGASGGSRSSQHHHHHHHPHPETPPPPPPDASRNFDDDDTGSGHASVLGRRFADRGSWAAGVRTSGTSAIPLQAWEESPRSPESTVARSSGVRSIPELGGVSYE